MNIKKQYAFSIAEALVTMLIVALIILMTMPLFTKKSTKGAGLKGAWECRIDPVTGEYKSVSIPPPDVEGVDPATANYGKVADDKKSCIFTPPKSARNFTINIIGGGGGGASASVAGKDADVFTTPGIETYIPDYTGIFDLLLVGGGGRGGSKNCEDGPAIGGALGGAAGGVLLQKNVELKKGNTYTLTIGAGGNEFDYNEGTHQNPGSAGGDTFIKFPDGSKPYIATGGKGGYGGDHGGGWNRCEPSDDSSHNWRDYGWSGTPRLDRMQDSFKNTTYENRRSTNNYTGKNTPAPGIVCNTTGKCVTDQVTEMMGSVAGSDKIGKGGWGATSDNSDGAFGYPGMIMITYSGLFAGGGGKAGTHVYKIYQKLPSEITVKIGRGGPGAVFENQDGFPGEASAFGSLIVAGGGEGGRARDVMGSSEHGFLAGADGGKSVYGGSQKGGWYGTYDATLNGASNMDNNAGFLALDDTFFGAGGGGGASRKKEYCATTSTAMSFDLFQQLFFPLAYAANIKQEQLMKDPGGGGGGGGGGGPVVVPPKPVTDYSECWGRGGRGAPGFVRVEWN